MLLVVGGLLGLFTAVQAQEEKVALDKLPKAVVEAVKKRFPKGELLEAAKETEAGKTEYEVSLKDDGTKMDVMVTPEGAITLIEKEIAEKALPKPVRATLKREYPNATYKRIEEVIKVEGGKETTDFYEILLETADKKKAEAQINPDGKLRKAAAEPKEGKEETASWTTEFGVERAELVSIGRNPYFILEPGYVQVLQGEGTRLVVTVLDETKNVDGVECRVVEEKESKNGKVVERARNYFAISKRTNSVFYFGEDVGGAWLSGVKGARFGLIMPGLPLLRARYYQEIAPGVAMDRAEIISLNETIKTPAGEFKNCLKIEETNPLEPGNKEYKYYAPGVGLVQEESMKLVQHGMVKSR
jgi:hypothetical protein